MVLCPPKAEVVSSNLAGSARDIRTVTRMSAGRSRGPLLRYVGTARHGRMTQMKLPPASPVRFTSSPRSERDTAKAVQTAQHRAATANSHHAAMICQNSHPRRGCSRPSHRSHTLSISAAPHASHWRPPSLDEANAAAPSATSDLSRCPTMLLPGKVHASEGIRSSAVEEPRLLDLAGVTGSRQNLQFAFGYAFLEREGALMRAIFASREDQRRAGDVGMMSSGSGRCSASNW